jgi:ABC-2 type transport system permease protein
MQLNPRRRHVPDLREHTLAGRSRGKLTEGKDFDVILVADVDMLGLDFIWGLRAQGHPSFAFDNVTFVLNCVDALVGDESFIELRKRRPRERPLTSIEEREEEFRRTWQREKEDAEREAAVKLDEAQKRLDAAVAAIDTQSGLDDHAKAIQKEATARAAGRGFELEKKRIEDTKLERVERAKGDLSGGIESIQTRYRFLAVGVTPIPAILAAIFVFVLRRIRERESVPAERSAERERFEGGAS